MSPLIVGVLAITAFIVLALNKMPIAFAFSFVGFVGLILYRGMDSALYIIGSAPYAWGTSEALLPLPLFVLMGQFAFYSGISSDLYDTGYKWLGRLPGGIALATTLASTGFAACSGASMAGAATFGSIAYPEMQRLNYDKRLSTGCIVAGGGLSSLIPPSLGFILIGFLTRTSVATLFIAGIMPGILLAVLFIILILVMCKKNPELGPPGDSFPLKEMIKSLKGVAGMLTLLLLVIGGLYVGVFTPTEAGAAGAAGAFLITLISRRLTWKNFLDAATETMKTTVFVLTMLIGASIFNTFLGVIGLTTSLGTWMEGLTLPPALILSLVLFIYIPLGMFLDIGSALVLTVPIFFPPLANFGYDPVWLGVLIILIAEFGFLTPPVGVNVFVVSGVTKVPLWEVFKGVIPFAVMMLLCLILLALFPDIVLFLPNIMS